MFHVEQFDFTLQPFSMQLYSTNNPRLRVDLKEAIFKGLPDDKGLFMPVTIPHLPSHFISALPGLSFQEIAFRVAECLLQNAIPSSDLRHIVERAVDFPAPVVSLDDYTYVLELFHGPSLAFKDFGARFMAELMAYFNREEEKELIILVATSGDTGGAVAAGFYQTPGIKVVILYPSGKVSPLQEKQLTTIGENIEAIEVEGTFDDCQALVKQAFLDPEINRRLRLSSANSINISRLIPQTFYYFEAYKQVIGFGLPVIVSVPSGNFGNLTAGLIAQRMGLPIRHFIAATNANDIVPEYLQSGKYHPKLSIRTLSNAMDVGNPSNFARLLDLYGSTWNIMREQISGFASSDEVTAAAILEVYHHYGYMLDPHGAVAYLAWRAWQKKHPEPALGIVLETAHPAKFLEDMENILEETVPIPARLAVLANRKKEAETMPANFEAFKNRLMNRFVP